MELPFTECYKIKVVEPIYRSTRKEREQWLQCADFNVFNLKSEQVFIDLLTDSGTGAMSDKQWGAMMEADESYAGSKSHQKLEAAVKNVMGFDYFLPTHQGRGAENVLYTCLVKEGDIIPGNAFFDTTKGHIEFHKGTAIDCTTDAAYLTDIPHDFKGNIDLKKLKTVLSSYNKEKIPMIVVTVTCNSVGGQPVPMNNIKEVSSLAKSYDILLCFDAARFAENAYFIKQKEAEYKDKTIKEIVKEMFSYADIVSMSAKKDALVNIGGLLAFRDKAIYQKAAAFNILFEGYVTYGGLAGRDMEAVAQGLDEATNFDTLETRIRQVEYLGNKLDEYYVPCQKPTGGNGIYVDAGKILNHIPKEEFRAQTLVCEIYLEGGIRCCGIGVLLADRDPITRLNRYPQKEFMRMAIPRRVYTNSHMDYVATTMANVKNRIRNLRHGLRIIYEAEILRHFTAKLCRISSKNQDERITNGENEEENYED